jgi:hypothetical protein
MMLPQSTTILRVARPIIFPATRALRLAQFFRPVTVTIHFVAIAEFPRKFVLNASVFQLFTCTLVIITVVSIKVTSPRNTV